jgi:hypothetical protein
METLTDIQEPVVAQEPVAVEEPKEPLTTKEIQNQELCNRLQALYPNVCQIAQELDNPASRKHYNPTHPATWARIGGDPEKAREHKYPIPQNPAWELKKLALAFAIDFPDWMKDWDVSADWSSYNKLLIQEIERMALRVGTSIFALANKHELRAFLHNRCQHILGFKIDYVPIQSMERDHELHDDDTIGELI